MKAPKTTLTLFLTLCAGLLTACTSNQVTAKVDSQGGQVSITTGSGNVVQQPKNDDQIRKELELKNKEIELAKKEAELANREKDLAQQKLADATNEKLGRPNDQGSDSEESPAPPKTKLRRQPTRPRIQSPCCEQSSYYPTTSYPVSHPAPRYEPAPSYPVSTYAASNTQVRSEPVVEYRSPQQVPQNNSINRIIRANNDDQPEKKKGGGVKAFFKKVGIVAAGVGLGYAAGGGKGAAIGGGIGAGAVLFSEMRNKEKEKRQTIIR